MAQKPDLSVSKIKSAATKKLKRSHQKSTSTQEITDYIRSEYGSTHVVRHDYIDKAIREMISSGKLRRLSRHGWVQLT